MKLNYDCLRDIMLLLENELIISEKDDYFDYNYLDLETIFPLMDLKKYSKSEIVYTLVVLNDTEFMEATILPCEDAIGDILISRLTYKGHEFIEHIKADNIWNKTKGILGKAGSISISLISDIAGQVIANLIGQGLG